MRDGGGSWAHQDALKFNYQSSCEQDPFDVALEDKADLLISSNEVMPAPGQVLDIKEPAYCEHSFGLESESLGEWRADGYRRRLFYGHACIEGGRFPFFIAVWLSGGIKFLNRRFYSIDFVPKLSWLNYQIVRRLTY